MNEKHEQQQVEEEEEEEEEKEEKKRRRKGFFSVSGTFVNRIAWGKKSIKKSV